MINQSQQSLSIEDKIIQLERTYNNTPDKKSQLAITLAENIKKYKTKLEQKKNKNGAPNPETEKTESRKIEKQGEGLPENNIIDNVNHISLSSAKNISTTMKDYYLFIDAESGKEYCMWKNRLRLRLLNFLKIENPKKRENKKFEVDFIVRGCLENIYFIIENNGRKEYKDIIKNKTYSIGDKSIIKKYGADEIRFGFNYKDLKRDFKF